ncbi:M3 family oligoendopeptidase [Sphingobacteriales bacterium UPWRP_1]|nr:oligoendopeptidase F [Sphingobacteriales bacterium TSM_CSM]PSJ78158.1 M3 family oligoendopeptidase [Sphingobacteriales bacterium UPWRP_1]
MKFENFRYERPNMQVFEKEFDHLLNEFENAGSADEQNLLMELINRLRADFESMVNIASIRYSIDATNPDYEKEQEFFDTQRPIFAGHEARFYQAILQSKFQKQLQERWGKHLFEIASVKVLTFHPSIIEDLQRENHLISEYDKLRASAKIMFEGKERNLSDIVAFETSPNREVRKHASEAKWQFFADNAKEFDNIFNELVALRHDMAVRLGFSNFVQLGYKRMLRTDYNPYMVADYRRQVLEVIVPLAAKLRKRQAQRLGIDDLKYYDLSAVFKSGNPTPKGEPDWIVDNGVRMYEELSHETAEFFNFMLNSNLMDLVSKKGKVPGGYCTFIENYKAPFIFSNFNGTSHDINVLTHEVGHAFQVYMSRDIETPEYRWPTYEACEIHSMSMEFLTWPWMHMFFGEDTEKFKFEHLSGAVLFLPYGVTVDEFQHYVYENPKATPAERNRAWRQIEQKYQPWLDYDGNEYLNNGGFWQKQAHIYASPFYYIDYTLAQVCAFQFWKKSLEDRNQALTDYINLCKLGGSKPFLQLVQSANLHSPFEDGCLQSVIQPVKHYLSEVNDMAL